VIEQEKKSFFKKTKKNNSKRTKNLISASAGMREKYINM
jgi:hypothetical protein